MPNQDYAFTDIEMWATINGTEIEIADFNATFAINTVPSASIKIAVGKDKDGNPAAAHREADKIKYRDKVIVYGKFKGDAYKEPGGTGAKREWNKADMVLFDGYISGPSYQRGIGAAALTFNLHHWMIDLAAVSKLSAVLHPRSSSDMFRPVVGSSYEGGRSDAQIDIEVASVLQDTWKMGVKEVLLKLAEKSLLDYHTLKLPVPPQQSNRILKETLDRMDNGDEIDIKESPLKPDLVAGELNELLGGGLIKNVISPYSGSSAWETVSALSADWYWIAIANCEAATVVPFVPTLATIYKHIGANEYSNVDFTRSSLASDFNLPIRGVGLYGSGAAYTGSTEVDPAAVHLLGVFDTAEGDVSDPMSQGQLLLQPAPSWIQAWDYRTHWGETPNTARFGNNPSSTANPSAQVTEDDRDKVVQIDRRKVIADSVAKARYMIEVFQKRSCTISGRLRLDVAPGSIISFETLGKNIPYYGGAGDLFGVVETVAVSVSAEKGMASSVFRIAYLHNQAEHDALSKDDHPLYTTTWPGTYLVKDSEQ